MQGPPRFAADALRLELNKWRMPPSKNDALRLFARQERPQRGNNRPIVSPATRPTERARTSGPVALRALLPSPDHPGCISTAGPGSVFHLRL